MFGYFYTPFMVSFKENGDWFGILMGTLSILLILFSVVMGIWETYREYSKEGLPDEDSDLLSERIMSWILNFLMYPMFRIFLWLMISFGIFFALFVIIMIILNALQH